jgi:hypothetical protein
VTNEEKQAKAIEIVHQLRDWANEFYEEYQETDNNDFLHAATDLMSASDDICTVMKVKE